MHPKTRVVAFYQVRNVTVYNRDFNMLGEFWVEMVRGVRRKNSNS